MAVATTMGDLGFDDATIDQVLSVLESNYAQLEQVSELTTVPTTRFGVSDEHERLGYHSDLARAHVVEAVLTMVEGLQHYAVALRKLRQEAQEADDTSRQDIARISAATEHVDAGAACLGGDGFQQPSAPVCAPVPDDSLGGEG